MKEERSGCLTQSRKVAKSARSFVSEIFHGIRSFRKKKKIANYTDGNDEG
jgi:hypothetical protein